MPEGTTTPPADGQQGTGTPPIGTPATGTPPAPPASKTFTQEELDAIVTDRLKRAVPKDYEELQKKAAAHDAAIEASKTELEKAQEKAAAAETARVEALSKANARILRAEIRAEAAAQKAVDPDVVIALLAGDDSISVDEDGNAVGVADAVKKLLKAKTYLVGSGAPARSGGEFGGNDGKTIDQQIAEAEKAGDFATARRLKINKGLASAGA